jgi:predicted amidophosphoribosyltransferase
LEKKFNGILDNGTKKELDKYQFVRALTQPVRGHGHENHHMFLVDDVIASYEECTAHIMMKNDGAFED